MLLWDGNVRLDRHGVLIPVHGHLRPIRERASLDAAFLAESEAAGLLYLKGHRAVGGMRASIYNAMPIEGVRALVEFMKDFAGRNG